ncbi:unnamed protein product, partial [Owenia fusiformis]
KCRCHEHKILKILSFFANNFARTQKMKKQTKLCLTLIWIVLSYAFGICLFTTGFLLKRIVVEKNSSCKVDFSSHNDVSKNGSCWMAQSYSKAVLIVIDALRFDFMKYNASLQLNSLLPYQNRMKTVHKLLHKYPYNSKLYKFIADPPTTTMQRLKGLTTVDNGILKRLLPELRRRDSDLLIAHFLGVDHCGHKYGPNHQAMGDKLDQMDEMIRSVVAELDEDTILFVLGDHGMTRTGDHGGDSNDEVDAALFIYSPSKITTSPYTNKELTISQIDLVPTISLLLGSAIPYSNLGTIVEDLFNHNPKSTGSSSRINQLFHVVKALRLNAYQIETYLQTYANLSSELPYKKFAELQTSFNSLENEFQSLVTRISHQTGTEQKYIKEFEIIRKGYVDYLQGCKEMCRDVWAKFDVHAMLLGIILVCGAIAISIYMFKTDMYGTMDFKPIYILMAMSIWMIIFFTFHAFNKTMTSIFIASLIFECSVILIVGYILYAITKDQSTTDVKSTKVKHSFENIFASLCVAFYCLGSFSNSFVVYEDSVVTYLAQTMTWVYFMKISSNVIRKSLKVKDSNSKKHKIELKKMLSSPVVITLILTLGCCICLKLAGYFRACREEQSICEPSYFLQSISSLPSNMNQYKNLRYILSVCSVGGLVLGCRSWLRHYGNMNGFSPAVLCVSYGLPLSAICVSLYWALQGLPEKLLDKLPGWQVTLLPRIVYTLTLTSLGVLYLKPLLIYVRHRDTQTDPGLPLSNTDEDLVPKMFNHLKTNWKTHLTTHNHNRESNKIPEDTFQVTEKPPPMVYGLATVYSSVLLFLTTIAAVLCVMLLRDGLAPSITLTVLSMVLFLELHSCKEQSDTSVTGRRHFVTWSCVSTWGLLSTCFFYTTGHQATVTTLQWGAAWTGFHGDITNHTIPAILLTINTFASQILFTIGLSLILFWPYVRGHVIHAFQTQKEAKITDKGEFTANEDTDALHVGAFKLVLGYSLFHGIKLLSTMCTAAVLRRHLMVWKIFAPRYVYEGASFLLISTLLIIMFGFIQRLDTKVTEWVETLEKKN